MSEVPWIPICLFTTAVVLAVITRLRPARRNPEFAVLAQQLGLKYTSHSNEIAELVSGEHPRGRFRRANDVIHGNFVGYPVISFTYTSHEEGRNTDRAHAHGYHHGHIWITLPVRLPLLDIRASGLAPDGWGLQAIRTESEIFNRRLAVRAIDDKFGHAVLHPRMMEFLLATNAPKLRISGDRVGMSRLGGYSPIEIWWCIHFLRDFVQMIPPFVWRDYALD